MTPERAKQERDRANALLSAYEKLATAKSHLDLINEHVKRGQQWKVEVLLHKDPGGNNYRNITIDIRVPVEIVQQQAADAWKAARRQVVLLGGELS